MRLIFVGTSHGIPESDRFCTSIFLEVGENVYIIDAGAPVSQMLLRYGFTHDAVKGVFITHLHGDHFDGIFEFS
ncbi:MAG: MBL fold metallo-hydrolase, partial [Clostridia bacterium]|nr:MBL fold metallo-hydrolase [Clostridia bacterium]